MRIDNRIYLDYNATTPVHPDVVKAMDEYYLSRFGNAGSAHSIGLAAYEGLDWARTMSASGLQAQKEEIIFTSGGSESDNMALQGVINHYRRADPDQAPHLIIDAIEHPAVWETANYLERQGVHVTRLAVDSEGKVDPKDVEAAITPSTALISIMLANNEIGTINPISEIGKIAANYDIPFHTDAVQAFTKVPIDVTNDHISLLSVSAHKFYGPKGVGFLYVRNDEDLPKNASSARDHLQPILYGGSQEFNMRPATENVPGVVGMAKAIEIAQADFAEETARLAKLRDYLIHHILQEIPGTSLNGARHQRLPHNVNVCFADVFAYDLMIELDNAGIACSVGAACHAGDTTPSRVLLGIGLTPTQAESSMRFSFGRWTAQEDLDELLRHLGELVPKMRSN